MIRSVLRTARSLCLRSAARALDRHSSLAALFIPLLFILPFFSPLPLRAQFSFKSFPATNPFCFQRDARQIGDTIRLAPNLRNSVGAIWYREKQEVASGFTTRFRFRMGTPGLHQEADGIAFVVQNFDSCTYGNIAQGIGYEGIPNSIAVEFDTWFNEEYDPDSNHISIQSLGLNPNGGGFDATLATVTGIPILGMGNEHTAMIDYSGSLLRIFLDDCATPVLETHINLDSLLDLDNGRAWVGMTSATGNHFQDHDLYSWEFQPGKRRVVHACRSDSVILEGPEGFSGYRWSTGDTTRTIAVDSSGEYQLFIADWLLCFDEVPQFTYQVLIYDRLFFPHLTPAGTHYLCPGDSILLSVPTRPNANEVVLWSTGRQGTSIVVGKSGLYSAAILDTNGCLYLLDTVEVQVRPTPEPHILPSDSIRLCDGDSISLRLREEFPEYLWSTGERTSEIVVFEPGVYSVGVVDHNGCRGFDTVEVIPVEEDLSASSDTAICLGESVRLGVSGRTEYHWSPARGLSCIDCPDPVASPTETTTYLVQGTNEGACLSSDSLTVTVRSAHADAGRDTSICYGGKVTLHGSGGVSYEWTPILDISCLYCPDPVVSPYESMTYYLHVVDEWGCEAFDSVNITVLPRIDLKLSNDTAFCLGGSAQLNVRGAGSYHWTPPDDLSCTDCPNPVASPHRTTTYYVTGTNSSGGCPAVDSVRVEVNQPPIIDAGENGGICTGESFSIHASGGQTYRWNPSPDLSCLDCPDPIARPTTTTTYYVTGRSKEGCESTDSVRVTLYSPVTVFAGEDLSICAGDSARLESVGGLHPLWSPAEGLSCTHCPDPVASPESTTLYRLTAWSEDGCPGEDSVLVLVRQNPEAIHLGIGRKYRGYPDQRLPISVDVLNFNGVTDIVELEFDLEYDPGVMLVDLSSIEQSLIGTLLQGWSEEIVQNIPGHLILHLKAPTGKALEGTGTLLRFDARLYLSNIRGTELTFGVKEPSNCFSFEAAAGYAQVDSICGLNFRLIELSGNKYVAPVAYPNPGRDRVMFEFGLGLSGDTRLEVFDLLGNRVGVIVDEGLAPGRYSVEWDVRNVSSGMYLYRLTSGAWSEGGEVRIER